MVRRIRSGAKVGLLYGQGGFVTKHHGLVLSREMPREAINQTTSVQSEADRNKRAVPEFVDQAGGKGKVEAFTVIYRSNGEVEHGVVMLRTEDGRRTLGRIPADDAATLAHLRSMDRTPIGSLGDITMADDGAPVWRAG
jgi:acetyl-CoA C-acetyltransferase